MAGDLPARTDTKRRRVKVHFSEPLSPPRPPAAIAQLSPDRCSNRCFAASLGAALFPSCG